MRYYMIEDNSKINSIAYLKILKKYKKNPTELNELLCLYMRSILMNQEVNTQMYLDELENMLGINTHKDVLEMIIK